MHLAKQVAGVLPGDAGVGGHDAVAVLAVAGDARCRQRAPRVDVRLTLLPALRSFRARRAPRTFRTFRDYRAFGVFRTARDFVRYDANGDQGRAQRGCCDSRAHGVVFRFR